MSGPSRYALSLCLLLQVLRSAGLAVSSLDGLTVLSVDPATGDLSSASSPGHAPLPLAPGSGSFLGFRSDAAPLHSAAYPNVIIAPCNASSPAQRFNLTAAGRLLTLDSTHCLDVWNCGTANGTVVDLYPCSYAATCGDPQRTLNELFHLDAGTGELYSLLGPPNTLCVGVSGAGPTVALWQCNGGASQQWAYEAASGRLASGGSAGMCLSAPPTPPPPPPPPPPLPPCAWLGTPAVSGGSGAPILVARNASCLGGDALVLVTDLFSPAPTSVQWRTTFSVLSAAGAALPAFSLPLGASLRLPAAASPPLGLWTPWTRGCVDNGADAAHERSGGAGGGAGPGPGPGLRAPGMCFGQGAWQEPFSPLPLPLPAPTLWRLGNRDYGAALAQWGAGVEDSITVPLATVLRAQDDLALTLLLSPEEPLLELLLRVQGSSLDFARLLRRLDVAQPPVAVTAHLRAHAADWRPALQLLLDVHPALVLPHVDNASQFDGLGGYSWQAPVNKTYADLVGFKTNWELSGTFMRAFGRALQSPQRPLFTPGLTLFPIATHSPPFLARSL